MRNLEFRVKERMINGSGLPASPLAVLLGLHYHLNDADYSDSAVHDLARMTKQADAAAHQAIEYLVEHKLITAAPIHGPQPTAAAQSVDSPYRHFLFCIDWDAIAALNKALECVA
jgi:hypothetical protein